MRWRRSALIAAAAMLTACGPALADTILHLADTETVMAHPDELVATLRVEASAASAAATQQVVNNVMAAALARARQVAGVTAATQGYTGWQATQPQRWQASQILTLRSHDGPALLDSGRRAPAEGPRDERALLAAFVGGVADGSRSGYARSAECVAGAR